MKLNKPYTNKTYAELAVYCNANNCHVEDKGEYLEAVANPEAERDFALEVRAVRNQYLADTDKYMISDYPITEDERQLYIEYRKYLRELPEQEEFPNVEVMSFVEWANGNNSLPVDEEEVNE